jgi:transmembrane sensor
MEFKKMPIKRFTKKITRATDHRDEQKHENPTADDPCIFIENIWEESGNLKVFAQIDTDSDWKLITERINHKIPVNYHKMPWKVYFLRIAALLVLTFGLSIGIYRIIVYLNSTDNGFTSYIAENKIKEVFLPDGSKVTLNTGSSLSYREDGFGTQSREVILDGEALFDVMHEASLPFKVFVGESVVEVTGTSFSILETNNALKVSVISGRVLLFLTDKIENKISISANQSGYLLTNNELKVEEGISANFLSWKTGHLIFEQTPIDSALMDIAHHFQKELLFETTLKDEITAEFQDQPLHEILDELKLVAGLQFDTTGSALIVRK